VTNGSQNPPRTYNNQQISEISRRVFVRAMELIEGRLSPPPPDPAKGAAIDPVPARVSPEILTALASVADAAAGGFSPDDDDDANRYKD
jgi:hypothetical protein